MSDLPVDVEAQRTSLLISIWLNPRQTIALRAAPE
jgi:hypothetical protein